MTRFLLALFGTVAGLVALLTFKTHAPIAATGALPEQSLPSASTSAPSTSGGDAGAGDPPASTPTTPTPSSASKAATSRIVTGSAVTTRYGVVQVKVTVSGTKITDVGFVQLTAFDQHSQEINSWAAPRLLQETLDAQSAQIDTVSGATYTTDGYLQSLQSALDQAGIR